MGSDQILPVDVLVWPAPAYFRSDRQMVTDCSTNTGRINKQRIRPTGGPGMEKVDRGLGSITFIDC